MITEYHMRQAMSAHGRSSQLELSSFIVERLNSLEQLKRINTSPSTKNGSQVILSAFCEAVEASEESKTES